MAFPIIPVVAAGVALGLVLLSRKKTTPSTPIIPTPIPVPIPNNGGRYTRPRRPPNPPAGSGSATVVPSCDGLSGDALARCRAGLLVHSVPSTDVSTRVGPEDTSPTSPHALAGEIVAVIEQGVVDRSSPPTNRQWAKIMTPFGNVGYVSWIDTQGRANYTNLVPPGAAPGPTPQTIAGVGALSGYVGPTPSFGWSRGYARCVAPTGCWLRRSPDVTAPSGPVVSQGEVVHVSQSVPGQKRDVSSPGRGGWSRVHVRGPNGRPIEGWMLSEWLVA